MGQIRVRWERAKARVRGWFYTRFKAQRRFTQNAERIQRVADQSGKPGAVGIAESRQTSVLMRLANQPRVWTESMWRSRYGVPITGSEYIKVQRALRRGYIEGARTREADFILWLEDTVTGIKRT